MADVILEAFCRKCSKPLLEHREENNEVAALPCGHVFHKICIEKWFANPNILGVYHVKCPTCSKSFVWRSISKRVVDQMDLFFDERNNSDYSGLQSAYKELAIEKEKLAKENSELMKRVITAEIKETLLTNRDLLEEKFEGLKWEELTPAFQKELLGKVQVGGRPFMNLDEILPINSKALMRLIKADEKDETLLRKIIEDYFEEKKQSTGKVDWEDLDDSLRVYATSKLLETTQIESLELVQVPLSSSTLVHLVKDKSDYNLYSLGKIVTDYVDEMVMGSQKLLNDLFKVALLECINEMLIGCLDVHCLDLQGLERLVEVGMLERTKTGLIAPYKISHDSVRYYITGMIMSKLIKQVKISTRKAFMLFHEGYADPLGAYFADYMSEVEKSCLANFACVEISDNTLAKLLIVVGVMRSPNLPSVIKVLKHFKIDVLSIVMCRWEPVVFDYMTFTLLDAAAVRGDLERVKCLLYKFGISKELTRSPFKNLMLACVGNTKKCSEEQIQERKEIIKELLKLNGDLVKSDLRSPGLKVHDDLVKFMVELGGNDVTINDD